MGLSVVSIRSAEKKSLTPEKKWQGNRPGLGALGERDKPFGGAAAFHRRFDTKENRKATAEGINIFGGSRALSIHQGHANVFFLGKISFGEPDRSRGRFYTG